jgi:uroporphyrinogen-III synthase
VALPDLDGFTVGITADRRWEEQAELLRRRGATVMHGPTIKTLPLGPEDGLRRATEQLIMRPPDVVIANTGIGMRAWFAAAESWGIGDALLGALGEARILSRGPKASGAVYQAGLPVVGRAASERLSEVVELAVSEGLSGKVVAFQRHGDDAPDAIQRLVDHGAAVVEVPVYNWKLPDDDRPALRLIDAVISGRVHALTFTSAPAVRNLLAIADEHDLATVLRSALNDRVISCCVGPVCAGVAIDEGLLQPVVPDKARLGPMILELAEALLERTQTLRLAGIPVLMQGASVVIDGERITLAEREAGVMQELLAKPGSVVTKDDLLERVWASVTEDAHVVEVTVARLRRRLGDAGTAIVTVPRRGYRLVESG